MLNLAIKLASEAHFNQVDLHGDPYILHPLRVMMATRDAGYSVDYQIVAVLHDVIEDTDIKIDKLTELGFSDIIIDAIISVTRSYFKENEPYTDYVIRAKENLIGRIVKIHDLEDNTRLSRIKLDIEGTKTGPDVHRLIKYMFSWEFLKGIIDEEAYRKWDTISPEILK